MDTTLLNEIRDVYKLQLSTAPVPNAIPVCDVNPKHAREIDFSTYNALTNGTSATIFTALNDRDTYITGACLSLIKDATATSTNFAIKVYIKGVLSPIVVISGITSTAQNQTVSLSFPIPIRIDKGSTVTITSGTANANIKVDGCVQGFYVFNDRA